MYISKLKLQNFRNYEIQEIDFDKGINVLYGDNAQGKTNILESIFMTAFGKSFRTNKEKEVIKFEKDFSIIDIFYSKKDRNGKINYKISNKRYISVNGVKVKKLSELLGKINIVIFTPDDINLLKSGPQIRRRFLDMMIGQLRPQYIILLNEYNKYLEQRNNFLKTKVRNENLIEVFDKKLSEIGKKIFDYRLFFINNIKENFIKIHKEITDEKIDIEYKSDCSDEKLLYEHLIRNREIDYIKGFTTCGIQRDDFKIKINDKDIGSYGSQGQNRTAILSLKLAEIQVIYNEIGEYPVLLLDDFMSELDEKRIKSFLSNIKNIQVIITCTFKIDIESCKSQKIENGNVIKL